ncbi:MAG: MarR family winged helix-turn-helix transcriptional regulator [Neisseria sp.]|nr:MarR family winged helix-turn-helix transcriptional regulator [Neisseria sp.]
MNQLDQLGTRISLIDSVFDQWIKQQDLNYNSFAVLYTLATEGSRTQKYIGGEWCLPKQTVSGVAKVLAGQGLLQWQEGAEDKRERLLSLTEKGREYAEPLVRNMQMFNDKVFAAFGEKRAARLFADLDALAELMAQAVHAKQGG